MADAIDVSAFKKRLKGLVKAFASAGGASAGAGGAASALASFGGANALSIDAGKLVKDSASLSTSAGIHLLLLGYEFPDCIMVVTTSKVVFLTTPKKAGYLNPCADACNADNAAPNVDILVRAKAPATDEDNYKALLAAAKPESGTLRLGRLEKEAPGGRLVEGWRSVVDAEVASGACSIVDCTLGIDLFLSMKDEASLTAIRAAAELTVRTQRKRFIRRIEKAIEGSKSAPHSKICTEVEDLDRFIEWVKSRSGLKLDPSECDFLLSPVIQSGGTYDTSVFGLKASDETLKFDTIITSLGCRYKQFGALVGRTYFVNPTAFQEHHYEALLDAQREVINNMLSGMKIKDVVRAALARMKELHEDAAQFLKEDFGCSIGIVPERAVSLKPDTDIVLKPGMVFYVTAVMENIPMKGALPGTELAKLKSFSMLVGDTVVITADGPPEELTIKATSDKGEVSWQVADESSEEEEEKEEDHPKRRSRKEKEPPKPEVLGPRTARRAAVQNVGAEEEARRREEHQRELMAKMAEEALAARDSRGKKKKKGGAGSEEKVVPAIVSYSSTKSFHPKLKMSQIYVDKLSQSVLIPLNGTHVPFHIATIKSITKSDEGGLAYLRLVFYSPGASLGKDVSPSIAAAVAEHPTSMFIHTVTIKSKHHTNINHQTLMLKQAQREMRQKLQQERETRNLVKQVDLKLDKKKVPQIKDLLMRPSLSGRKSEGTLEAHINGLRFVTTKGEKLSIIYSNIRHAIFQPCKKEHLVLMHFNLKNPILVGKKKQLDVQFYTEVVDQSQNLDGRGKSMYDPDEMEEEHRERALRDMLNKRFAKFVKRVEDTAEKDHTSDLSRFDMPNPDVGFHGVPNKEMVFIMPCTGSLVSLTETPAFVVSLDDI